MKEYLEAQIKEHGDEAAKFSQQQQQHLADAENCKNMAVLRTGAKQMAEAALKEWNAKNPAEPKE